ncbi:ankyrin repeat-containing protein [Artemisia annua]|uniref:Ankyrin repeat-containing protein n=1 Tax=Artemisia annua TaxID=35608 RepID=A0A2U1N9L6_ARTAN|nr:ankyrin repeat-containing protein [Artemisia annua]
MLPSPPQPQPQSPLTGAKRFCHWIWDYLAKEMDDPMAERKADALLVAASVIAAMNYQAGVSPPGGAYQDTRMVNGVIEYQAGQAIAAYVSPYEYKRFSIANTISFSFSMTTMFLFLSGLSLKRRIFSFLLTASMFTTITATTWSYKLAMEATTPAHDDRLKIGWDKISHLVTGALIMWFVVAGIAIIVFTANLLKPLVTEYRQKT